MRNKSAPPPSPPLLTSRRSIPIYCQPARASRSARGLRLGNRKWSVAQAETTEAENSKVWSRLKTPLRAPARAAFVALAALIVVATTPARAEYDANGRYVPSPMGKPSDPYRSYVPGYTGKPGGTKRPSTIPQAYELKPPQY